MVPRSSQCQVLAGEGLVESGSCDICEQDAISPHGNPG